jgi:protoporphyrin/coproporphyrin ferrochelatase
MKYIGQPESRHAQSNSIGVLLVNLGTPAAPSASAVRTYLRQFLSDPRVIELPRLLWWLLLNLVILPIRGFRSAANYRKVWTEQGSPLMTISRALQTKVQAALNAGTGHYHVELAMSYGEPAIPAALKTLMQKGAKRLLILPLYPQYSGTTTGSVFDGVTHALQRHRWVPDFRFISQYYEHASYTEALVDSIRSHWQQHGRARKLLMSFHGIPKRYFSNGDLYHCHCYGTARRVREALNLNQEELLVSFQSRVGKEEWLKPYTDELIKSLPATGVKTLDVICPGFAVDCLETLEEIKGENAEYFLHAGGESLRYIEALNDSDAHAELLCQLIAAHAAGWPEAEQAPKQLQLEATELVARVAQHQRSMKGMS